MAGDAGSATSIATISVSSPNAPPKPSLKSIGTPITSATSAPFSACERVREKNSSWSAGTHPRASPFRNTGIRSVSASSSSACSPWPQYRSVPAMITGRSAFPSSRAARSIALRARAPAARSGRRVGHVGSGSGASMNT